jgi:hypothetical protein
MKRLLCVLTLAVASCADEGPPRTFPNNDLQLTIGNAARMACSCMFVSNMPEAYCRDWVRASPDVARFSVDANRKTVESSAFLSWAVTARFIDEKRGCVLE